VGVSTDAFKSGHMSYVPKIPSVAEKRELTISTSPPKLDEINESLSKDEAKMKRLSMYTQSPSFDYASTRSTQVSNEKFDRKLRHDQVDKKTLEQRVMVQLKKPLKFSYRATKLIERYQQDAANIQNEQQPYRTSDVSISPFTKRDSKVQVGAIGKIGFDNLFTII